VHLRAIHKHFFQDIYDWAGEVRVVEISKGGQQFQFRRYIESGMTDIHAWLERANLLKGLHARELCSAAGQIMGYVNYVHPFREGTGRAQLHYLKQLAQQAGHPIDLTQLDPRLWLEASRISHESDYKTMSEAIAHALKPD
jgi:cell filamentation protein